MTRGSVSRPSRRTAPSTARSASRLCGGILDGRSKALSLFPNDVDLELCGHLVVETDRHRRLPERLDRLVELDSTPLYLDALLLQEVHDVLRGDGSEQLAFLGRLPAFLVGEALDPRSERIRVRLHAIGLRLLLGLD